MFYLSKNAPFLVLFIPLYKSHFLPYIIFLDLKNLL